MHIDGQMQAKNSQKQPKKGIKLKTEKNSQIEDY